MAEIFVSAVIDAPVGAVWGVIRNFNALPAWTPFVVESRIERNQPAAQVGCVRVFRLRDGGLIRERLLALSDYDFSMTYSILESPMAVEDYVATLRLLPVTQGNKTFGEWSASFRSTEAREAELVDHIGRNVFLAGLVALQRRLWPAT